MYSTFSPFPTPICTFFGPNRVILLPGTHLLSPALNRVRVLLPGFCYGLHSQASGSSKDEFLSNLRQRFGDKQRALAEVPQRQILPMHTATPFPSPHTFCHVPAWLARISSRLAPAHRPIGKQVHRQLINRPPDAVCRLDLVHASGPVGRHSAFCVIQPQVWLQRFFS